MNLEEYEDILFNFYEGLFIQELEVMASLERAASLSGASSQEIAQELIGDLRLKKEDMSLQEWEEDRFPPGKASLDWEWFVSLLVTKKKLSGSSLVRAVAITFQISPETAKEELEEIDFIDPE